MKLLQRVAFLLLALLLSAATAWAQDEAKAPATPTHLPGEEKLSAQERAERDFLMPVRRKQAAKLRATAEEVGVHQPAIEATAQHLEAIPEEEKLAPPAVESKAAPATVHHRSSTRHRRASSHSTARSSSRRKTTHKSTAKKSGSKKTSTKKKSTRRRR